MFAPYALSESDPHVTPGEGDPQESTNRLPIRTPGPGQINGRYFFVSILHQVRENIENVLMCQDRYYFR